MVTRVTFCIVRNHQNVRARFISFWRMLLRRIHSMGRRVTSRGSISSSYRKNVDGDRRILLWRESSCNKDLAHSRMHQRTQANYTISNPRGLKIRLIPDRHMCIGTLVYTKQHTISVLPYITVKHRWSCRPVRWGHYYAQGNDTHIKRLSSLQYKKYFYKKYSHIVNVYLWDYWRSCRRMLFIEPRKVIANKYEGGLKCFRPQHEDGSTRQWKLVNVVVHLLTVTH